MNTLSEWLSWLEISHPKSIDLGLERITKVARLMQLDKPAPTVITVAGTNGKGSCVNLLADIYKTAGYRVGSYTSPHLHRFNERIRIQQQPVTDDMLCASFEMIERARDNISLTYFEFTTLAALTIFSQTPLDVVILEVGLGGRLDAVNIVDSDVTIISSIDKDHCEYLGDTLDSIGYEKAGIMRMHKPVVIGQSYVPESVLMHASQLKAPLYHLDSHFSYKETDSHQWSFECEQIHLNGLPLANIVLSNAATVLQTIQLLIDRLPVTTDHIMLALRDFSLMGRYQCFSGPVDHIFDIAHNPAACRVLAQRLHNSASQYQTTHIVFAALKDKDHQGIFEPFCKQSDYCWYLGGLGGQRGCSAQDLAKILAKLIKGTYDTYPSVLDAYQAAKKAACPGDRIVVFGSFFTVAEAMHTYDMD